MSAEPQVVMDADRRKRIRRSALLFSLIALAFYVGFIVMAVVKAFS
jgi:uncharacterized membrane protein (DUF485 family)